MTRFEREEWDVRAAPGLRLFDTAIGRLGILICYDSEFALPARALAEAGAEIEAETRPEPEGAVSA